MQLNHPHRVRVEDTFEAPQVEWTALPPLGSIAEIVKATGKIKTQVEEVMNRPGAPPGRRVANGRVWVLQGAVSWVLHGRVDGPTRQPRLAGPRDLAGPSGRTPQGASEALKPVVEAGLVQRLAMGPVCVWEEGVAYLTARKHPGPVATGRRRK